MTNDTSNKLKDIGIIVVILLFAGPLFAFIMAFIAMWTFPHVVDAFWKPYSSTVIYLPSWGEWFAFGWFATILRYMFGLTKIKAKEEA